MRRWRVKSKHEVTALCGFDLDGDGHPETISGWANGKIEVRSDRSAEVIFKDTLSAPVSARHLIRTVPCVASLHRAVSHRCTALRRLQAILQSDYRSDGHTEVLVCSADGEVRYTRD